LVINIIAMHKKFVIVYVFIVFSFCRLSSKSVVL
jgi:hypothetical protein